MVRVLTLNVNGFETKHGPWPERRTLINEVIDKNRPDVVALQAAQKDQAQQLADAAPFLTHIISVDGLALLSRFPFSQTHTHLLSAASQTEDPSSRAILHGRIDFPDGPLHVFNCHFSWVGVQLEKNILEAVPFFRSFRGPRILIGDMNATPDNPAFDKLRQDGWIDLWSMVNPSEPGFTFESDHPSMRIDYFWADQDFLPRVRNLHVMTAGNGHGPRLSDHAGLLGVFS